MFTMIHDVLALEVRRNLSDSTVVPLTHEILSIREEMLDRAVKLASEIASRSPVAVQGSKINLNYARDHPTDQSLQYQVKVLE